jgi:cation/acetate symporter
LPVFAGLSGAALAVPASLLLVLPGLVYAAGFDHLAYGLGLLAGVVLAGGAVAPRMAGLGAVTITAALGRRFGVATAVVAGFVIWLVLLPVLTGELALVGTLAESLLGIPYVPAVAAGLGIAVLAALAGGERGLAWLAVAAFALLAAALIVPLALMAGKAHGFVVPQLGYGGVLPSIAQLEEKLVESGLVDFDTFAAHVTPFLRLTPMNDIALVVTLALGTSVFPPLLASLALPGGAGGARFAGAWAAFFLMTVLISIPALAAYAKLEVYAAIEKSTPLAELPAWLEAPLSYDLAHIHGTSSAMLGEVAKAVSDGASEPTAIADRLANRSLAMEQRWYALDDATRSALIETAKAVPANASAGDLWHAYVASALPAAAAAAGNTTGTLTQASLVLEPLGLLLALPGMSGGPAWVVALLAAGGLAAALVVAAALIRSLASLAGEARRLRGAALAVATGAAAAALAAFQPDAMTTIVIASISLAAAALFPVLAAGLAWHRTTAAGAIAAMLVGAGVTLYYDAGIQVAPAAFYRTWAPISDAGEAAIEEFNARAEAVEDADGAEAKAAAQMALDDWARGTATRSGLANWAGVNSALGALFGAPLALVTLWLVSLVTGLFRKRTAAADPPQP